MHVRKKEIVFLPYKASMWDCMESVWRAACADTEHCVVRVVPIPYCDKKADGSPAAWHWEKDDFPADVEVTDFRQYDLAAHRPDVIYIHNPYDYENRSTSVDSHFYSAELKKYTDMLVYIPYFFLGVAWPIGHCGLGSYQNVDRIILQKAEMPVILKNGEVGSVRDFLPAGKVVGLGSPKADRVLYCEQHTVVPEAWRQILAGRRAVFYNVSLSAILYYGETMLRKIRYVMECVADQQDLVLLFRPHPLLENSLRAIAPDVYTGYMELKREFVQRGLGILDTTPDVDMAVAVAAAYVGESGSSVPQLFGVAGKPIFYTDDVMLCETPEPEDLRTMQIVCFANEEESGKCWFILDGYQALFQMDRATGRIHLEHRFSRDIADGWYTGMMQVGNTLVFVPGRAPTIDSYDLATKEWHSTAYEAPQGNANFRDVVRYGDVLVFLPLFYPAILCYDMNSGKCNCEMAAETLAGLRGRLSEETYALSGGSCLVENRLYLSFVWIPDILEVNLDTGSCQLLRVDDEETGCMDILPDEDGQSFWLIPWTTRAIKRWNPVNGSCQCYDGYPAGYTCMEDWGLNEERPFSGVLARDGYLWLFPACGNMILRLEMKSGRIEQVAADLPYRAYERKSDYYMQQPEYTCCMIYGPHEVAAMAAYDRRMVVIDTQTGAVRTEEWRLSESLVQQLVRPMAERVGPVCWSSPYALREMRVPGSGLPDFLEYVRQGNHDKQAQQQAYAAMLEHADGSCGRHIHAYILQECARQKDN